MERGLQGGQGGAHTHSFVTLHLRGRQSGNRMGCPRSRKLTVVIQWIQIIKGSSRQKAIAKKDCEPPATHMFPTLVTLPRGLFREPGKKVIFKFLQGLDSYLSSAWLCLTRCQLWRPWDFSHLLSPAVLSNRGFKNSLLQVFRGQVPFLPKMCGMVVSRPQ